MVCALCNVYTKCMGKEGFTINVFNQLGGEWVNDHPLPVYVRIEAHIHSERMWKNIYM